MITMFTVVVMAAACSDGGVSQAEYDQRVAELTLAQRDLAEARDQVAALRAAESAVESSFEEIEDAILEALGLRGVVADPGRDRLEVLAEAVRATTEERDLLLEAVESGHEEFGPSVDIERIEWLHQVATTVHDWARPSNRPQDLAEIGELSSAVEAAGDEMLSLAYEQLRTDFEGASDEEQVDLLMAVAFWAVEMMRSTAVG
jgi:hypothetical protein